MQGLVSFNCFTLTGHWTNVTLTRTVNKSGCGGDYEVVARPINRWMSCAPTLAVVVGHCRSWSVCPALVI